jgi:predicted dehydrogenase
MTLEVSHSVELQETAKKLNRILMVGHLLLYNPGYVRLKEIVASGELGEICYIHAQRIGLGKVRKEEDALFSLAPHDISVMLYLFSEAPSALSCTGMDYLQNGIYDIAFLTMRFSGKRMGYIQVSWFSPEKIRQHTVVGTKKMAQVDEIPPGGCLRVFDSHVELPSLAAHSGDATVITLPGQQPLKEECTHFLDSIKKGATPRSDGCQGLDVVRILDAAEESMRKRGEWVELSKV